MGFMFRIDDIDRWVTVYKPIVNDVNPDASWSTGDAGGIMFETYGAELAKVQATPVRNIWTLIETDGETLIIEGYHFIDRMGYFITEVPWVAGLDYEVKVGANV